MSGLAPVRKSCWSSGLKKRKAFPFPHQLYLVASSVEKARGRRGTGVRSTEKRPVWLEPRVGEWGGAQCTQSLPPRSQERV